MTAKSRVVAAACAVALCICAEKANAGRLSLDGDCWTLSFRQQQEGGAWRRIPATVPGDVFIDLERAGLAPDPMKGTNVFAYLRYEQCEWLYERTFPAIEAKPGERIVLRFGSVDTRAEYFLNGACLGRTENMFVPAEFDVTGRLVATNSLAVLIKSPLRDPQNLLGTLGRTRVGGTDVEGIRKAQHSFGWDIMPRLVSCGIVKSVSLETLPETRFGDMHWMVMSVNATNRSARVVADCQILAPWRFLHKSRLRLTLSRNGRVVSSVEHPVRCLQTRDIVELSDVDLWWPRDAGEPALYDAKAELLDESGELLAEKARRIGIRTVELEHADYEDEANPGTFRFVVNGVPLYMHGCDVTPHGRPPFPRPHAPPQMPRHARRSQLQHGAHMGRGRV